MRPSIQHESAVFDPIEAAASHWAVVSQFFQGVWVEVLVVVLALYIYLWQAKSAPWSRKRPKASNSGSHRQVNGRGAKNGAGSKVSVGLCKGDSSQQVQKLVISLLHSRNKSNPATLLEQYEEVFQACGSNLRWQVPDDQNARSMYLALIGCAVTLPDTASVPSRQSGGTVDYTSSIMQRWTARLLSDMQVQHFPRSVDFYAAVLKLFTNGQHFKEGLWVYEVMTKDAMEPSSPMLISLMNVAIAAGESEKALFFFERVVKCSVPSVRTIMTVLRVFSANRDWRGATTLLDRMDTLGTPPDNLVLNNVLGMCVSLGEVDGAQQLLSRWKDVADVVSCNILLKGCSQQANLVKAEAVLADMVSNGPAPNLISHNTVMDCAVRCMQLLSAEKPVHGRGSSHHDAAGAEFGTSSFGGTSFEVLARLPWALLV